jgi:Protein of unknown function (DUF2971)
MPKSRKRLKKKRRSSQERKKRRMDIAEFFEQLVLSSVKPSPYPVLYHYTSLAGALGIVSGQRFWSTAHDCTNDTAELVSAHSIIIEVAQTLRQRYTSGITAKILDTFIENYATSSIDQKRTIYLSCFSVARDDTSQWREYGDRGNGICLGIRILEEPPPKNPDVVSTLVEVEYSEASLREWLVQTFEQICATLSRSQFTPNNCEEGLSAFYRIAAFASIRAKHEEWKRELEVRHVTVARRETSISPCERISAAGKVIRYLPVSPRVVGKLIAFAEIIVGPNQDMARVQRQFETVLASKGYVPGSLEYPKFTFSSATQTIP